jgi:hypothetical protein
VTTAGKKRSRSNKYSGSDSHRQPPSGMRQKVWVAGYTRSDGRVVKGHYRYLQNG